MVLNPNGNGGPSGGLHPPNEDMYRGSSRHPIDRRRAPQQGEVRRITSSGSTDDLSTAARRLDYPSQPVHPSTADPKPEEASRGRMRQLARICLDVLTVKESDDDQDEKDTVEGSCQVSSTGFPYVPRGPPKISISVNTLF